MNIIYSKKLFNFPILNSNFARISTISLRSRLHLRIKYLENLSQRASYTYSLPRQAFRYWINLRFGRSKSFPRTIKGWSNRHRHRRIRGGRWGGSDRCPSRLLARNEAFIGARGRARVRVSVNATCTCV